MRRALFILITISFSFFFSAFLHPSTVKADGTCNADNKICPFGGYFPKGEKCGIAGVGPADCCKPGIMNSFAYYVFCDSPAATQDPSKLSCPTGYSHDKCATEDQKNSGFCCNEAGEAVNGVTISVPFVLCNSVPEGAKRDECKACVSSGADENVEKVWTSLGCIRVDDGEGKFGVSIINALIRIGLGLAGGALLLMILASAFLLSTSQGDPKKTEEAQHMITSGITGLLFILFSMVILRTVGIDILQIPGF